MITIKGPGVFLAQFLNDTPPFHDLRAICLWAEALGFKGVQIPTSDTRCIDLKKAAESKNYADEIKGIVNEWARNNRTVNPSPGTISSCTPCL